MDLSFINDFKYIDNFTDKYYNISNFVKKGERVWKEC